MTRRAIRGGTENYLKLVVLPSLKSGLILLDSSFTGKQFKEWRKGGREVNMTENELRITDYFDIRGAYPVPNVLGAWYQYQQATIVGLGNHYNFSTVEPAKQDPLLLCTRYVIKG